MLTGGATSSMILRAIARNSAAARPVPSIATGRPASPPAATAGSSGTWPSSSTPISSASDLAATRAEQRVLDAVLAGERRHVLDHAAHPQEAAPRHVGGPRGDLLRRDRRRGDDQQIGARQHPRQAHLHVAGAGRHVDEQVVELAPVHVAQELLDRLVEHQPSPHQRGVLLDQEAGADDLQHAAADRQSCAG